MVNATRAEWSLGLKLFWLVVGGTLCLLWGVATASRVTPKPGMAYDFAQEWTSARNFFTGHPIYLNLDQSMPLHMGTKWHAVHINVNAHPPGSVFLLLPFGLLDYRTAQTTWTILSLLALAVSVWLIIGPRGLAMSPWYALPIAAILLSSNALAAQVYQGQFNLVLLLLLTLAWLADRAELDAWSGAMIGLAAALKLFPAFLLLYFVVRRRWTAVVLAAVWFGLVNGLGMLVLGWEAYRSYFTEVVPRVNGFRDYWANASVWGYWSKLLDAPNGHILTLWHVPAVAKAASLLSAGLLTALTAWRCYRAADRADRDGAFGLCVIAMILVAPIAWDHYFLMLVLPLAMLWCRLPATVFHRGCLCFLIVVLFTLRPAPIWLSVIGGPGEIPTDKMVVPSVALPRHALTVLAYEFYALLALFCYAFWAIRAGRANADERCATAVIDDVEESSGGPCLSSS